MRRYPLRPVPPRPIQFRQTVTLPPRSAECPECEECEGAEALSVGAYWDDDALESIYVTGAGDFGGEDLTHTAKLKNLDGDDYTGPWPDVDTWTWVIATTLFNLDEGHAVLTGAPNGYTFELTVDEAVAGIEFTAVAIFTIYAEDADNQRISPNLTLVYVFDHTA